MPLKGSTLLAGETVTDWVVTHTSTWGNTGGRTHPHWHAVPEQQLRPPSD